jgi:uncharacterized membrane protein YgaE (UPF0421/DUF939 family)
MAVILFDTEKETTIFGIAQYLKLHITVDGKIKSRHTANAVLKQSGIKYKI